MVAGLDWTGVTEVIARAEGTGAVLGVSVIAPSVIAPSVARFSHRGDRRFVAASTIKIAIMIELFRQIDAGAHTLDDAMMLRAADKSTGSGVIQHLHEGIGFTLGDLVYLMMSISDNSATNMLIETVGMDQVNAAMRGLGMLDSLLGRLMRGRAVLADEQENFAVPDEFAAMIAALLDDRAASPAGCAQMVALLEKQQNNRRIARHLDGTEKPRWGSKTGSLPGVVNDVGFIMAASGPVIIGVFSEGVADPHWGEQVIGDISSAALAAVA